MTDPITDEELARLEATELAGLYDGRHVGALIARIRAAERERDEAKAVIEQLGLHAEEWRATALKTVEGIAYLRGRREEQEDVLTYIDSLAPGSDLEVVAGGYPRMRPRDGRDERRDVKPKETP